ncbi:MAG TPA: hypothetical protein VGC32_07900 [Solirubrobacterales bacterium]
MTGGRGSAPRPPKLLAAVLAVAAPLAVPAAASATLSYTKDLKQPVIF